MTGMTSRAAHGNSLREKIVSGAMTPGEKLPSERELSESWALSRPAVREVLQGLAEQDLVEIRPGRGAYVREPRPSDAARPLDLFFRRANVTAADMVEARLMLETEAAMLAAERATESDLEALRRSLADLEEARGVVERARLDLRFHSLIARASANPVVQTMFASIARGTLELMLRSLLDPDVAHEGLPLHHDLWLAVSGRRPADAREMMAHHLTIARRRYGPDLARPLDMVARKFVEQEFGSGIDLDAIVASVLNSGYGTV